MFGIFRRGGEIAEGEGGGGEVEEKDSDNEYRDVTNQGQKKQKGGSALLMLWLTIRLCVRESDTLKKREVNQWVDCNLLCCFSFLSCEFRAATVHRYYYPHCLKCIDRCKNE